MCCSGSIFAFAGRAAPAILKMDPFRAVFEALRRCLPECHLLTGGRLRFRRGHSQFGAVLEARTSVRSSGCRMRVPGRGLPVGSVGSAAAKPVMSAFIRTGFPAVVAVSFRAAASASCKVRLSSRPAGIEGRSIPACAGEPSRSPYVPTAPPVYPRVCGGTPQDDIRQDDIRGLSSRVRGNQGRPHGADLRRGSIPACAGEPRDERKGSASVGSIPACAGEPEHQTSAGGERAVYPRVCGGTQAAAVDDGVLDGLSPRVRGNRRRASLPEPRHGSIPACAGEPFSARSLSATERVYPRVCGGTLLVSAADLGKHGLSPRVRGNRKAGLAVRPREGSIPACAGEPPPGSLARRVRRVYPRVCGGTMSKESAVIVGNGLSPRVRGNLLQERHRVVRQRSIPACAGEPSGGDVRRLADAVYPRVCGGTAAPMPLPLRVRGLSPRVRGNQKNHPRLARVVWSIPACAGEPDGLSLHAWQQKVYPRVCGGTASFATCNSCRRGLSPRVRGNPAPCAVQWRAPRSIPACAGEPRRASHWRLLPWVYPRVCGGTMTVFETMASAQGLSPRVRGTPREIFKNDLMQGLSPRVRGNLRNRRVHLPGCGSIPACAGEPPRALISRARGKVYPRVCGGTDARQAAEDAKRGLSPRVRGNRPPCPG